MWRCCFTSNAVTQPTKLTPVKSITAEVPVTAKPVTLMFRLPEDVTVEKVVEDVPEEVNPLENSQGEEVPSVGPEDCNNVGTLLFIFATMALLYAMSLESERAEL
jgi:hypothetical protein